MGVGGGGRVTWENCSCSVMGLLVSLGGCKIFEDIVCETHKMRGNVKNALVSSHPNSGLPVGKGFSLGEG